MPLLILLITILFNWKLTLTRQYVWLEHPDGINQVLPWMQFQAHQWHSLHFPAWDPNEWTGQPLFGQAQPGSAYPFNWLLFLAPLKNGFIRINFTNWYVVLIRFLAALAAYALCRDLKCSRIASLVGAVAFGLGGFVGTNGWPQMMNGAVWAPLVFLFLFRAIRGENPVASAVLSGFFLGFCWLSGHHQVPTYVSAGAIGTWIWACVRDGRWNSKIAKFAVLSMVVAVMASAFQTFPTAEYGRLSVRWVGAPEPVGFNSTVPYYVHEQYAHRPTSLFGIFLPNLMPDWNPFIGLVAFSLAILGVILAWGERQVRCLATIALASILFTLGPNSLLHGILYAIVPLIEKTRSAGAATAVFGVAIAPLAAIGLDRVLRARNEWWTKRAAWCLAALGILLALAAAAFAMTDAKGPASDVRLVVTACCALAFSIVLAVVRSGVVSVRGASVAALFLVLFELANVTNYWLPKRGPNGEGTPLYNNLEKHNDIARFLLGRPDHGRIEYQDTDIPYNFGDWFNVETFQSYTASVTNNIWQHDIFQRPVRDFLGIRYSIAKSQERPEQRLLFEGRSGLNVFENPNAFPRVWSVHQSMEVADRNAARAALGAAGFNARKTTIFIGSGPKLEPCMDSASDRVEMTLHEANRVAISANLACAGMVILDDTWYPGWRATVDGKPAEVYEAYGIFRGVLAPAGQHTIDMRYRPASIIGGGILTLLAMLAAGWSIYFSRRATISD